MKLKKLIVKNIRSYEQQEIEFPDGSLLLVGDVGSGKTSLLLAIEYAFFGLQPGQKGASLLRNDASSGEVLLECEIDNHNVIIERKLKREQKSVVNDFASITIDGETTECSVTELKLKILNLLNYPPEFIKKNNLLYRYTVYTPQEQMKQIILEDPETRLNVLRHVFGIEKYKRIKENLVITSNYLKEEIKLLEGELKNLDEEKNRKEAIYLKAKEVENQIKEKEALLKKRSKERAKIEESIKEIENQIKEKEKLEKEAEKTKVMLSSKQEHLFHLSKEEEEIITSLKEENVVFKEEEYLSCLKKQAELKYHLEELEDKKIEISAKRTALERKKSELISNKDRIFSIKMCPFCLQDVPEAHKHNIFNETETQITLLTKELQELKQSDLILSEEISKIKNSLKNIEETKSYFEVLRTKKEFIEKSKNRLENTQKLKENLQKDLFILKEHLDNLKANILNLNKFENLYLKKKEELREAQNLERQTDISLAESKKELTLVQNEISFLEESILQKEAKLKKLADIITINDWLSNYFTSVINFTEIQVLRNLRQEFCRFFSEWFSLIGGDSFEIRLDENFSPIIMQGGIEMDYNYLSGGERTAVALAYRLALNQTINSLLSHIKTRDLIILDEPTEGFSDMQIEKMREVFEQLNVSQLIIVSHEQKIENFVENIIRIKKEDRSSSIDLSLRG